MQILETDSYTNKDISTAVSVGVYTATAAKQIHCRLFADAVTGNGTYAAYFTVQRGGAGSSYRLHSHDWSWVVPSGTTAIAGMSEAIAVSSGDVVTCYLDGLGTDTTTPDTICEWWEDNTVSALAASGYTVTASAGVVGDTITQYRGDSWSIAIADLGTLTGYTNIWFTVKRHEDDADTAAIIMIDTTTGLKYLNGAAVAAASNSKGSITVTDGADGDITIALDETMTDDLTPAGGLVWDVQALISGAVTTLGFGALNVVGDVTKAVS